MRFSPVKAAVIGCGMISRVYFENITKRFSILELVGCSDLVPEKSAAAAETYHIRQMTNEEILSDPSIELVLNLTYASAHYEVNRAVLSAGKHCYCEKMMCVTLEEAKELDRIRREKGVFLAVAPDTFLGASQQTARMIVDRGLIGEPLSVTARLCRGYHMIKSSAEDAVRKYSVMQEGGGIPFDMGGYYLHEMFNLFGPVESLSGYSCTRAQNRPYLNPRHDLFNESFFVNTPNTVEACMKFRHGPFCLLGISSEYHYTEQEFIVYGTEGTLTLGDPNGFGYKIYLNRNGEAGERLEYPLSHPFVSESRGVGAADMAWAIRTGRAPRLSFEMGYHALEVILGIAESDRSGKRITFDTTFDRPAPLSTECYPGFGEERSLFLS